MDRQGFFVALHKNIEMANSKEDEVVYKVDALIDEVIKVQEMNPEKAKEYLVSLSKSISGNDYFFFLCRMLFKKVEGGSFRAPFLGEAIFLGGTSQADWPLSPIEIVDGIPFLVVKGYTLKGRPESKSAYLEYCLEKCAWNDLRFKKVTFEEKRVALDKLISSERLRGKLSEIEERFLKSQI